MSHSDLTVAKICGSRHYAELRAVFEDLRQDCRDRGLNDLRTNQVIVCTVIMVFGRLFPEFNTIESFMKGLGSIIKSMECEK